MSKIVSNLVTTINGTTLNRDNTSSVKGSSEDDTGTIFFKSDIYDPFQTF